VFGVALWWIGPQLGSLKYALTAAIWTGLLLSAAVGYIYTPNYGIALTPENRREFWIAWVIGCVVSVIATYLIWQTPI
jgi:lipoprotein signal peptidase